MTYEVSVVAEYNIEDAKKNNLPRVLFQGRFEEEEDARSALFRYLEDESTLGKLGSRFRPEYVQVEIRYRSELGEKWDVIYTDVIII